MYVYIYIYMCVEGLVRVSVCVHEPTYVQACKRTHVNVHLHMHLCMFVCTYIQM